MTIKHQKIQTPNFHRYVSKAIVGLFDTDEHAEAGLEAAEHQLRLNPGPGIVRTEEIGRTPVPGIIWVLHLDRLGAVTSRWDSESRSIINETGPKHVYRTGFVIRQATLDDRRISVVTFGEGVSDEGEWYNPSWFKAWKNGNWGPIGFFECDDAVRAVLSSLPGAYNLAPYQPLPL